MSEVGATCRDYNLICEIVAACIKRGIFSKELFDKYQILTSSGIQKRYLNAVARRGKVELKKEYLLVNCGEKKENVVNNQINVCNNSINECKSTQRREEKRREYIYNTTGGKKNKFNDFKQRQYDYEELEKKLLGNKEDKNT